MAISGGKPKNVEPDIEELLEELELRIERLKTLYEQYFMGIEKMEPHTARKEVTRKMLELQQLHIRNTALRYRFNALNQKLSTYVTYWNRTLRSIENGTYLRQVARVGRDALRSGQDIPDEVLRAMPEKMRERIMREREKVAARAAKLANDAAEKAAAKAGTTAAGAAAAQAPKPAVSPGNVHQLDADDVVGDHDAEFEEAFGNMFADDAKSEVKPAPPPPPATPRAATPAPTPRPATPTPPPAPRAAPPALPPGMDERSAQELFKRFVQAKKLLGESTDNLRYEHIVATIAKQAPAIMTQHKAKGVEFSVVIKDDKVILKATPKK